jgi:CBS domain-containing protein
MAACSSVIDGVHGCRTTPPGFPSSISPPFAPPQDIFDRYPRGDGPGLRPGWARRELVLTTIDTVLARKGRDVWSVPPGATVHEAIQRMAEKRIEALLVLSEDGSLVGILTERDCARRVTLDGRDPRTVRVHEVMSSPVIFVTGTHTIGDCMKILSHKGFAHLPVIDGERLAGVVSMGDLVSALLREQDHTISHLEGYITGKYPG